MPGWIKSTLFIVIIDFLVFHVPVIYSDSINLHSSIYVL